LRRPDLGGVASGRNALGAERERPYLRDARRRPRPRLRPFVDRRVAHRVLDARTLPLARVDGLVCVLVAGRVGRPCVLRLLQRRLLRRLGVTGKRALARRYRRPHLGSGRRGRRRRIRRQLLGPHRGGRGDERACRPQLSPRSLRPSIGGRNATVAARILEPVRRRARPPAAVKRAAVAAALAALVWTPAASAAAPSSAQLLRRGIDNALARHWLKPADASRYRRDVARAVRDESVLPPLRAQVIASQLAQLQTWWDSYTSPRALALFAQLEQNLDYFETHRIPNTTVDVSDGEGVVYRWFSGKGLEFHPLASFSSLANAAAAHEMDTAQTLSDALLARAIPRAGRLIWEYSFSFCAGRPPWASGMAQALAAQALARAGSLLTAAAVRAYAAVPPLLMPTTAGPWIRLYGFDREVVLNAQLQTILSLREYGRLT